jgi:hypothetical protein
MNFKKLGIVLFLLIAVAGFSMSSVSASVIDKYVTVNVGETKGLSIQFEGYVGKITPVEDAAKYATVRESNIGIGFFEDADLQITGLKLTPEGKTADFKINSLNSNRLYTILHVTVV